MFYCDYSVQKHDGGNCETLDDQRVWRIGTKLYSCIHSIQNIAVEQRNCMAVFTIHNTSLWNCETLPQYLLHTRHHETNYAHLLLYYRIYSSQNIPVQTEAIQQHSLCKRHQWHVMRGTTPWQHLHLVYTKLLTWRKKLWRYGSVGSICKTQSCVY